MKGAWPPYDGAITIDEMSKSWVFSKNITFFRQDFFGKVAPRERRGARILVKNRFFLYRRRT